MIQFKHSWFFFRETSWYFCLSKDIGLYYVRKTIPKIAYTGREFQENFIFQATFAPKIRHFFCVLDDMKKMIWCLFCLNPIYMISFFNKNWSKDNSYKFNKKKVLFLMRIRSQKFPRQFLLTDSKKHLILNITFRIIYRWLKKKGNSLSPQKFGTTFFI